MQYNNFFAQQQFAGLVLGNSSPEDLLKLNKTLRGYARYLIVQDPITHQQFSVGMRHVVSTDGGRILLSNLKKNVFRTHKRHIREWLCISVIEGSVCPMNERCPHIHITSEGYEKRRSWIDAAFRTNRKMDGDDASIYEESMPGLEFCKDTDDLAFWAKGRGVLSHEQCQMASSQLCQPNDEMMVAMPNYEQETMENANDPYAAPSDNAGYLAHLLHQHCPSPSGSQMNTEQHRFNSTKQKLRFQVNLILSQQAACYPQQPHQPSYSPMPYELHQSGVLSHRW